MKKLLCLISALALVFSLTACGGPSPADSVDTFLQAYKDQDEKMMEKVYAGDVSDFDVTDELSAMGLSKSFQADFMEKAVKYNYLIGVQEIEGTTATVRAKITTYEIGVAAADSIEVYKEKAASGAGKDELGKVMEATFTKKLDKLWQKEYAKEVIVQLEKDGESWKLCGNGENKELANAFVGNMLAVYEKEADCFKEK